MDEAKREKLNFIQKFYKSIIDFDIYSKFIEEPLKNAIKYLAKLVLIFSILVTLIYVVRVHKEVSEGVKYLRENVSQMSIKDKKLSYNNDEEVIYENSDNMIPIVIVNTSDAPNIEEYKNKIKLYDYGFIILKEKILVSGSGTDEFAELKFSDLDNANIPREQILSLLGDNSIYIFLSIMIFIVEFVQYFVYSLFVTIMLSFVGQIIALVLRLRMSFKSTYIIGIYALTLPTVLNIIYIGINTMTGFVVQYFNWMYTTISYIYVCVAILMIKTDFINLKKEMMRIKIEEEKKEDNWLLDEDNREQEEKNSNDEKNDDNDEESNDLKEQTDS